MMTDEYLLRFSPALVRRAVLGFWWRTVGFGYPLALMLSALCVGFLAWQGDRSWVIGFVAAVLVLGIVVPIALLCTHYRQAFAKLRGMKTPEARIAVGEAGLTVTSDLARSEIPWSTITEVWRFPDFWLLVFSRSQFMTIPLASLPADVRGRIAAGGKVRG